MLKRIALVLLALVAAGYGAWHTWDYVDRRARSRNAREIAARLETALNRPVTLDVNAMAMRKVLARLERECGVEIEVDGPALNAEYIVEDPLITLRVREVPLRETLNRIAFLVSREVVAVPRAGRVLITTFDEASDDTYLETYPLPPHLVGPDGITDEQFEEAVENLLISNGYALPARHAADYPLSAAAVPAATPSTSPAAVEMAPGGIAVVVTPEIHRDIQRLLTVLEEVELNPDLTEPIELWPLTVEEKHILDVLQQPAEIDAQLESPADVLADLSAAHGVSIRFDPRFIQDADVLPPIELRLRNVSLRTLLRQVTRHCEAAIEVRDDAVWLTSHENVEINLLLRVYPVHDLLWPRGGYTREQLTSILTSIVMPTVWTDVGGTCGAQECGHALVISADEEVHAEIKDLLATLRRHQAGLDPLAPEPASRARLEKLLKQNVSVKMEESPLQDVVTWLADEFDIAVVLDRSALDAAGVTEDTPLTLQTSGRPLAAVLNDLLRAIESTWMISDDELLVITTREEVETELHTCVYDVRHLVSPDFDRPDDDGLMDLITSLIAPTSWTQVGGTGAIESGDGCLIVAQTDDIHVDIQALLTTLESLYDHPDDITPRELLSLAPELDQAIQAKLDQVVTLDVEGVSLADFTKLIESRFGIEAQLDSQALDSSGINTSETLHGRFQDITLRSALKLALLPLQLTLTPRDGALLITSPDELESRLLTRVYNVADILVSTNGGKDFMSLIDMVTESVQPSSWTDVGGTGTIDEYNTTMASALVISQTRDALDEIDRLFAELRHQRDPGHYPAAPQTPAEKRIAEALAAPCELKFKDASLNEFAQTLRERWGVNVISLVRADDVPPLTCDIREADARKALHVALATSELDVAVMHEAIVITLADETVYANGLAEAYYKDDEIARSPIAPIHYDALELLRHLVDPWSWDDSADIPGAEGSGEATIVDATGMTIIRQSLMGQAEVKEFLEFLRASKDDALPTPPLDAPMADAKRDWIVTQLESGPLDFRTRYAAYAAGKCPAHAAYFAPALVKLLQRLDPVRDAALQDVVAIAIARLGPATDAAAPTLAERLASLPGDDRRETYLRILGYLGPEAAKVLMDVVEDGAQPEPLRGEAAAALFEIGAAGRDQLPRLIEAMARDHLPWIPLPLDQQGPRNVSFADYPHLLSIVVEMDPELQDARALVAGYADNEDEAIRENAKIMQRLLDRAPIAEEN